VRLALAALAAAFSSSVHAADIDKAKLGEARSLVAEAAAVEQQARAGQVTRTYADGLRDDIAQALEKLKKEPAFADLAGRALAAVHARDEAALKAIRDRLTALERSLGRAG
jgi:hypothetical protein